MKIYSLVVREANASRHNAALVTGPTKNAQYHSARDVWGVSGIVINWATTTAERRQTPDTDVRLTSFCSFT